MGPKKGIIWGTLHFEELDALCEGLDFSHQYWEFFYFGRKLVNIGHIFIDLIAKSEISIADIHIKLIWDKKFF